ncbi:MAG: type 1 glutamine amidotransferase [Mangrovibacterium sp.]
MKIFIINSAEPEITEFTQPIAAILKGSDPEVETIDYRDCPITRFGESDGVIISGSPQGDDIVEHHQPFFQWIRTCNKPVLGICAGHHIAGYMYGSTYLRSEEPESGRVTIEILKDDPIFTGLPKRFEVWQMHNDSITLPSDFIHLAKSAGCMNQAMRHAERPLYTLQFHPEYINSKILLNFADLCRNYRN